MVDDQLIPTFKIANHQFPGTSISCLGIVDSRRLMHPIAIGEGVPFVLWVQQTINIHFGGKFLFPLVVSVKEKFAFQPSWPNSARFFFPGFLVVVQVPKIRIN